jgi:hypothetical protein
MTLMNKAYTIATIFSAAMVFTSCGGWTEKDKSQFIESCETLKLSRNYCDCVLENAMKQYSSMDAINEDEKAMAEIITSTDCLAKIEENEVAE